MNEELSKIIIEMSKDSPEAARSLASVVSKFETLTKEAMSLLDDELEIDISEMKSMVDPEKVREEEIDLGNVEVDID